MNIEYYIIDPTGNITALVTTDVPKCLYKTVTEHIMKNNRSVEQVGFVKFQKNEIQLNMSGDEFCGNALMSAAVLNYYLKGKRGRAKASVSMFPENQPINVTVSEKEGCYDCRCILKLPNEVKNFSFTADNKKYTFPLVCFDGITHIIADESLSESGARSVIRSLAKELSAAALGIMIFNSEKGFLKPLVYVRGVDTLFLENSCASGSCAIAAVKKDYRKPIKIVQRGGVITAERLDCGIMLSSKLEIIKKCSEEIDYAKEDGF